MLYVLVVQLATDMSFKCDYFRYLMMELSALKVYFHVPFDLQNLHCLKSVGFAWDMLLVEMHAAIQYDCQPSKH